MRSRPDFGRTHNCARCDRAQCLRLLGCWDRLLCRAGVLRCRALPTVRAENGDLHAAVLLAVVPRFLVVYWLVFAQSNDLDAIHGDIMLPYEVGLHGLGTATAKLEVIFGSSSLVREALDSYEVTLHA